MKPEHRTITVLHLDDSALALAKAELALVNNPFRRPFIHIPARTSEEFFTAFETLPPKNSCVVLDVMLDEKNPGGITVLRKLRAIGYRGPVLMMSNLVSPKVISDAMRQGASDFLSKGYDEFELPLRVLKALKENSETPETVRFLSMGFGGESMVRIADELTNVLKSSVSTLLVTGETGTGKEVVAHLLKSQVTRGTPFVSLNCAAVSENLIEAELFGSIKGSYTGSTHDRIGILDAANGGWVFLDEVARLSLTCQAALLRAIETGEIRRVGSAQSHISKFRVIAATNENLEEMIAAGTFRRDLFQRLCGYRIELKPLRDRREELPDILDALVARLNQNSNHKTEYSLAPAARALLLSHDWSNGNVRELWQILQAATVQARGSSITVDALPKRFLAHLSKSQLLMNEEKGGAPSFPLPSRFPIVFAHLEEKLLVATLFQLRIANPQELRSQRRVATALGISRKALQYYLWRLHLRQELPVDFQPLLSPMSPATQKAIATADTTIEASAELESHE
jgi:DNA-binding NtrC family response regulator